MSYAYDGLNDFTSIQSPDTGSTAKTFNAAGNVLTSTDARGDTTTYTYDAPERANQRDLRGRQDHCVAVRPRNQGDRTPHQNDRSKRFHFMELRITTGGSFRSADYRGGELDDGYAYNFSGTTRKHDLSFGQATYLSYD